ncbi:MAG: GAF domain-containing protein [candidate division WOR-3 bacterium]
MRNVLVSFLDFLKLKNISFILSTYDGRVVSDYRKENFVEKDFDIKRFLSSIKFKRDIFTYSTFGEYIYFNFPNYEKIIIFFKNEVNTSSIMDIYLLAELLDSIDSAVCFLDKDLKVILSNQSFQIKYGDTYLGNATYFSEYVLPDYLEKTIISLKKKIKQELFIEMYDINGNSSSVKVSIFPWEDYSIVIIYDLKEKEIWTKEIEGLKRIQNLVFDAIAQGIIVLDREGNIIKFNKFTAEKYKFTNSEMIGKNIFDLFPDLLELKLDKILSEIIETKKTRRMLGVKRYSTRLKKELVQNLYGYPLIENGRCVGVVILIEDITEKKMIEEEYYFVQKKTEIVNNLNNLFSSNIDIKVLIPQVLKYYFKNLKPKNVYYVDVLKDEQFKLDVTTFDLNKIKSKHLDHFKNLRDENVIYYYGTKLNELKVKKNIKNIIYLPIIYNKKMFGKIITEFTEDVANDRFKKDFIQTFYEQVGNIFDKSYLYEEKNESLKKLEVILKVSKILSQDKDYKKSFRNLLEFLISEINADRGFILVKTEEDKLRAVSAIGIDEKELMERDFFVGKGVSGTVALTKEPLMLDDLLKFPNIEYTKGYKKQSQAGICVPIIFKGELVGVLMLTRFGKIPFTEKDFELVKIISNNSASFIKSLLLQMDSENKIEQLTILYKIFTSLRSSLNLKFLSKIVTATLGSLLKSKVTLLLEKNEDESYQIKETYFENEQLKTILLDKKKYYFEQEINQSVTNFFDDPKISKSFFKKEIRYATVLPIFVNKKDKFLLIVFSDNNLKTKIYDYTFNAIVQELYIKFESALLFDENERKLKQYNIISNLTEKLIYVKSIEEFFKYLLESAVKIVDGTYASLLFQESGRLVFKASLGIEIEKLKKVKDMSESAAGYVYKTGNSLILNDVTKSEYFKPIKSLSKYYKVENLINVPLKFLGRTIGVLCVDNKKSGYFSESDKQFLETLANTAIIAISRFEESSKDLQISDLILNNIPSGVVYIDRNGKVIHFNNSLLKIGEYEPDEIFNMHYLDLFEDKNGIIDNVIKSEKPLFRDEIILKSKKRGSVPCGISITPIKFEKDLELVCIIQDLSEIKKIQNELKAKENLAMLGQMAAGMAHEIKNPLSGILTGMEFLKMRLKDDDILTESIDLVIKEVKRLDRLVNDMTSFAKAKTVLLSKVNILDVLNHAVEMVKNKLEETNISLNVNINEDIQEIMVDEEQMIEVFMNILLNAVQSIGKNGHIEISIKKEDNFLVIDIYNDGPKIPEENLSKIFAPFFTTKSGGTGLGLAISFNIIKEHNGTIFAVNRENGVSFVIKLPLNS